MSTDRDCCRPLPCGRVEPVTLSRRDMLRKAGAGFGSLALAHLLGRDGLMAQTKSGLHFPAKAKSVIWLYMEGGPSAMDTFDPKPQLTRFDGQPPPMKIDAFFGAPGPLMKSPFAFKQYGDSGAWVCEHYEPLGAHVDDIAFLKGCHAESNNHSPAMYQMNTGQIRAGFPSAGSWISYGMGRSNDNLPAFVVMPTGQGNKGGPGNWAAGFLPSSHQGTTFRAGGTPVLNLDLPEGMAREQQRRMLDLAGKWNQDHAERNPGDSDLQARIESYELAYRMQTDAKEATDLSQEPEHIREMYGLNDDVTREYGAKVLLARRLVERDVRFVQVYPIRDWDSHAQLARNHSARLQESGKPVAALLTDLKQRGLFDETLVIWGGEFGRLPVSKSGEGRDHNPHGFLIWMAGAGIQGGVSHGATDDIGYQAVENITTVPDIHATILHLMGIDHTRLTYFHNGREYRLTDVSGSVIRPILT